MNKKKYVGEKLKYRAAVYITRRAGRWWIKGERVKEWPSGRARARTSSTRGTVRSERSEDGFLDGLGHRRWDRLGHTCLVCHSIDSRVKRSAPRHSFPHSCIRTNGNEPYTGWIVKGRIYRNRLFIIFSRLIKRKSPTKFSLMSLDLSNLRNLFSPDMFPHKFQYSRWKNLFATRKSENQTKRSTADDSRTSLADSKNEQQNKRFGMNEWMLENCRLTVHVLVHCSLVSGDPSAPQFGVSQSLRL